MSDVTLSAAVRNSLLSLQGTSDLIERTQGRLSSGLRVASAVDDPVAFFSAKTLSDRAGDLLEKKDGIDQGVSTVTAALDGVEGIEALVSQMKGIANSMKSATTAQIDDLVSQFNDLRTQINNLATDSTYQGTNLINGTGQTLQVEFSEQSASVLNIASVDLQAGTAGLSITSAAVFSAGDFKASNGAINTKAASTAADDFSGFLSTTQSFSLTFAGPTTTYTAGETVSFTYGTGSTFSLVAGTGSAITVTNGQSLDVGVVTASDQITTAQEFALVATQNNNLQLGYAVATQIDSTTDVALTYNGNTSVTLTTADGTFQFAYGTQNMVFGVATGQTLTLSSTGTVINVSYLSASTSSATGSAFIRTTAGAVGVTGATAASTGSRTFGVQVNARSTQIDAATDAARYIRAGDTAVLNTAISELDDALTTLRTQAQTLGSNVALLNTRLNFTEQYVNTLQGGADKLTLADINEEGANLLALQTRQQLGIQSLSLAAQSEASILSLFG